MRLNFTKKGLKVAKQEWDSENMVLFWQKYFNETEYLTEKILKSKKERFDPENKIIIEILKYN